MKKPKKRCRYCGNKMMEFSPELHDCRTPLPHSIQKALEDVWFIRGNGGTKHNQQDHYYIQRLIEGRIAEANRCKPTKECRKDVDEIMRKIITENEED